LSIQSKTSRFVQSLNRRLYQAGFPLIKQATFSRFAEDRILAKYVAELLPSEHHRTAVDIGAGDGIRWSNTHALFVAGWKGLAIEADANKYRKLKRAYRRYATVSTCNEAASPDSVASLLRSYNIEKVFEVLSLDIDGNDYWVLQAILEEFRPRLIVTEINEKIPTPLRLITKYDPEFQLRHHFYGFSIMSLADLCRKYDYAILELEYNNAFLAPRELAGDRAVAPETAYRAGYLDRPDRKEKFPLNFDLDEVLRLSPDEALVYLNNFYSPERGNYYLSLEPIPEAL
jgi:hypothetical protein